MTEHPHASQSSTEAMRLRWKYAIGICLCLALGVQSCAPELPIRLMAFSPRGKVDKPQPFVTLKFNRPVVAAKQVGVKLKKSPVKIVPALAHEAIWTSRQVLLLKPLAPLKTSIRYRVQFPRKGWALLVGPKNMSFYFPLESERLTVLSQWGGELRPVNTYSRNTYSRSPSTVSKTPVFRFVWNQPVDAAQIASRCRLKIKGSRAWVGLRAAGKQTPRKSFDLHPQKPLQSDKKYRLRCANSYHPKGPKLLSEALEQSFRTHPAFQLRVSPTGQSKYSSVKIELHFATPVTYDAISGAMQLFRHDKTSKVLVKHKRRGSLDADREKYTLVMRLRKRTRYTVVVKGLKDRYGQSQKKPVRASFVTGDPVPRLVTERGIYAVESKQRGYPIWSRNLASYKVTCARIPTGKLARLLTTNLHYTAWSGSSNTRIKWSEHGLKPKVHRVKLSPSADWKLSYLKLHRACGGKKPSGVYFAILNSKKVEEGSELEGGQYQSTTPPHRLLANVTDMGVLLKVGASSGLVWVTSLDSGRPVGRARVQVFNTAGKRVYAGKTDGSGLLRLPGSKKMLGLSQVRSSSDQRVIVVVQKGDDTAVVDGNWANGLQLWNFGVAQSRGGGKSMLRGFIQSDRGLYKPGETVHFKGLVREIRLGRSPRVPKRRKIQVEVEDTAGSSVFEKTVSVSSFGGFAFRMELSKDAKVGDYYVKATMGSTTFRERFSVEEFRKARFELKIPAKRHWRQGEKLRFPVEASYLFGAPLAHTTIEWSLEQRPHALRFANYPQHNFVDWAARGHENWWNRSQGSSFSYRTSSQVKTDAQGKAVIQAEVSKSHKGPQDYALIARATDDTQQSISKTKIVTVHPSAFYVGIQTQEYVQAVGMPFALNLVALDPRGRKVSTRAKLHVIRRTYKCKKVGKTRWYLRCKKKYKKVFTRAVQLSSRGRTVTKLNLMKPGTYILRIAAKDRYGAKVSASDYVWVLGKGQAFWSGDESTRIGLIASKASYNPGEMVKLVPKTSMGKATILTTFERNGILDAKVRVLQSTAQGIRFRAKAAHAPNVFVSVALVQGRQGRGDRHRPRFSMGLIDLKISTIREKLKIAFVMAKKDFKPGELVRGKLRVTGHDGRPVRSEVSLSVADEGLLMLINYKTPDPLAAFYKPWGLGVDNATNLNRIVRAKDAPTIILEQGGDDKSSSSRVRSNFVNSAFWRAQLVTDHRGEIPFRFRAPDNLTAFRMMAVAADKGSRFGSADTRIRIRKKLMLTPIAPRFLTVGDRVRLGVKLRNYAQQGTATVRFAVRGLKIDRPLQRRKMAKDSSHNFYVWATVQDVAKARLKIAVRLGRHRDAFVRSLPIHQMIVKESRTLALQALGTQGLSLQVKYSPSTLTTKSRLHLTVDRTGMGGLGGGLSYLIQYPYGCLEQTLSRFVPLTKVQELVSSLKLKIVGSRSKMRRFVKAGLEKVYRHQDSSGHFKLWPSARTNPYLTAYALYGLNEARRAGLKVRKDVLRRGAKALGAWVHSKPRTPRYDIRANQAMAAFVLGQLGRPDSGLNARLYASRAMLPDYGKAFLLRAMHQAKAPKSQIRQLLKELAGQLTLAKGGALVRSCSFGARACFQMRYSMSSQVRDSAIVLSALLEVAPKHPMVARLTQGLKDARDGSGRWENTQENFYALIALADVARSRSKGRTVLTVKLGSKKRRLPLRGGKIRRLSWSLARIKSGQKLQLKARGRAHINASLVTYRKGTFATPVARGITVKRSYHRLSSSQALQKQVLSGEIVRVRLEVRLAASLHYVALVDRLPSGFEAINPKFATSFTLPGGMKLPRNRGWVHREYRDDRVQAFANTLGAGTHVFEYLARATTVGQSTAPPARAEAMYKPGIYGRTAARKVRVKAQP